MNRRMQVLVWLLSGFVLLVRPDYAQQEQKPAPHQTPAQAEQKPAEPAEKPLGPGWLSLDCCVGVVDKWIADNKAKGQDALGIGISGYIDVGYTWATTHPGSPASISLRVFDKDYNRVQFN